MKNISMSALFNKIEKHRFLLPAQILYMLVFTSVIAGLTGCSGGSKSGGSKNVKPNILFAISDDQSYPHASAYGCKFVETPGFDQVAERGVLFHNVFAAAPQCSPSRASILTGRYIWQNDEAGTHAKLISCTSKGFY